MHRFLSSATREYRGEDQAYLSRGGGRLVLWCDNSVPLLFGSDFGEEDPVGVKISKELKRHDGRCECKITFRARLHLYGCGEYDLWRRAYSSLSRERSFRRFKADRAKLSRTRKPAGTRNQPDTVVYPVHGVRLIYCSPFAPFNIGTFSSVVLLFIRLPRHHGINETVDEENREIRLGRYQAKAVYAWPTSAY